MLHEANEVDVGKHPEGDNLLAQFNCHTGIYVYSCPDILRGEVEFLDRRYSPQAPLNGAEPVKLRCRRQQSGW
jgi:hypothetical protein